MLPLYSGKVVPFDYLLGLCFVRSFLFFFYCVLVLIIVFMNLNFFSVADRTVMVLPLLLLFDKSLLLKFSFADLLPVNPNSLGILEYGDERVKDKLGIEFSEVPQTNFNKTLQPDFVPIELRPFGSFHFFPHVQKGIQEFPPCVFLYHRV
jgi:hypothetical protein